MSIVKAELFDYELNKSYLEKLCREYPFITASVIGRTCLNRSIFSLSIGNEKKSVLLAGGFHGSEWITCLVLYKFIERLAYEIKHKELMCSVDVSRAFSKLGITVVPCVTPDAVEIARKGPSSAKNLRRFVEELGCEDYSKWNANARGIDINHNFSAGWDILRKMEEEKGITGPAPRQFGGEFSESESETRALTRLCRLRSFRQVMALHAQGEELYFQYGENTPKNACMMAKIIASACGYTLVSNEGLASHGGFKDWFIEEFARPGFTLEIGKGENPLPLSDFHNIYSRIEEALLIFALM